MIAVLLLALASAAAAAPRHAHHDRHLAPFGPGDHHAHGHDAFDPFADEIFDTRRFWGDLAQEMRQIDQMLATLNERFSSASSDSRIEGNEYRMTIPLSGFDEKDIVVKAKEGFLMVQAIHNLPEGGQSIYIDAKTLPASVNVTGTWTFDKGVLKIVFPLKPDITDGTVLVTQTPAQEGTEVPFKDREEMGHDGSAEGDADVGLHGDLDEINALFTNEIPKNTVEATTYSVDLKDEVEFVPVRNIQ